MPNETGEEAPRSEKVYVHIGHEPRRGGINAKEKNKSETRTETAERSKMRRRTSF